MCHGDFWNSELWSPEQCVLTPGYPEGHPVHAAYATIMKAANAMNIELPQSVENISCPD